MRESSGADSGEKSGGTLRHATTSWADALAGWRRSGTNSPARRMRRAGAPLRQATRMALRCSSVAD